MALNRRSSSRADSGVFAWLCALTLAACSPPVVRTDGGSDATPFDQGADLGVGETGIGDAPVVDVPVPDGYSPVAVVSGTTTPEESAPAAVMPGSGATIALGDGTRAVFHAPNAASGAGAFTQVTLSRESTTVTLSGAQLQTSGATRVLRWDAFDPAARGVLAADFAATVTIPARELGALDRDALVVLRIADEFVDGRAKRDNLSLLPAHFDAQGNLVAYDYLIPDAILFDRADADGHSASQAGRSTNFNPGRVRYVPATLQSAINWSTPYRMVRMVPSASAPARRIPWDEAPASTDMIERSRCTQHVIVLVHGHNEEEGLGSVLAPNTAPNPWGFAYKRDVWTPLYEHLTTAAPAVLSCTRFYEFVYPTYHPAFTPYRGRARLDQDLAAALASALGPLLSSGQPFDLSVVAHSMGGLVARAGLAAADPRIQSSVRRVVTWGSPHLGSPLVSLRYVLGAWPRYVLQTATLDAHVEASITALGGGGLTGAAAREFFWFVVRKGVRTMQVDTPGTRDLRWVRAYAQAPFALRLGDFFATTSEHEADPGRYALTNGTEIYSGNLTNLDAMDPLASTERYQLLYGVTDQRLPTVTDDWVTGAWSASQIAIGATVIDWLTQNSEADYMGHPRGASDGASPVASMAGAGLAATRTHVGNIDHEQLYGAPDASGTLQRPELARQVAMRTLSALGLDGAAPCPTLAVSGVTAGTAGATRFAAQLTWPGDSTPGRRVQREAFAVYAPGSGYDSPRMLSDVSVLDSGAITAVMPATLLPGSVTRGRLVAPTTAGCSVWSDETDLVPVQHLERSLAGDIRPSSTPAPTDVRATGTLGIDLVRPRNINESPVNPRYTSIDVLTGTTSRLTVSGAGATALNGMVFRASNYRYTIRSITLVLPTVASMCASEPLEAWSLCSDQAAGRAGTRVRPDGVTGYVIEFAPMTPANLTLRIALRIVYDEDFLLPDGSVGSTRANQSTHQDLWTLQISAGT